MKGLQASVKAIKEAGFTHIKVELEAQLNRRGYGTLYHDTRDCDTCKGKGYLPVIDENKKHVGNKECGTCNGEATIGHGTFFFERDSDCQRFINTRISNEAKEAINFMRFYNDGSVDSEVTFTLPIDEPKYIIEVINAFKELAEKNGHGMDVAGAGMHIAVLPRPLYPTSARLPADKIQNFRTEVAKLLPALYIACAADKTTRGLSFRRPQISASMKYSAIYTRGDTMLEYRIFDTCYQRPETMYEYIGVIARTLEYYKDPTKKVTTLGETFPLYEERDLKALIKFPEQVEVLKKQLRHVRPNGMTIKEFLEKRGIELKVTEVKKSEMENIKRLKTAYKEHVKAHQKLVSDPLDEYQEDNIQFWKEELPGRSEDWYWEKVTGRKKTVEDEKTYIRNNIKRPKPAASLAV